MIANKVTKTKKIDIRNPLFSTVEDLIHKELGTLKLNCGIKISGFKNKNHLRVYTRDLNEILYTHPDSYKQITNDKNLTYKIIRLE